MFTSLDLPSLFSPLKKKGIDISTLIKALTAYKLSDNFSIKRAHSWLMQPETREYYDLPSFTGKTLYRLLETLGENSACIISGLQDRLFSRYQFEHTDVNLDWTSLVLHGSASPLGKYGYSRDHRPDKQQITLGITELAHPINVPIGVTVKAGNVNDVTHFRSTFLQSQKKLTEGSLIIFDKGAGSKQNLELIGACGHDYLTAKKLNKSDDKIIKTFWQRNPVQLNHDGQTEKQGIYGIKIVKPGSVTYFYFSEGLEAQNLDALSRKVYRQFMEAEVIQECISRNKKLPKKIGIANPLVKITYSVQTKLVQMSEEEALAFLRERLNTGRGGFFALTSSRNLTLAEALERYRKKDSIEKIFHSLKNEIEIKPLRVWTENSIRGAILIGFLAQLFVSLVRYEVPEVQHVATKFIKYSLMNLTVTMMKGKEGGRRCLFSNFDALNTAILELKCGVG
jgi:transposase